MARQFFTRFLPCVALTPAVSAFLGSNRDQFAPYIKKDAFDQVARKKELLCLHQKLYALSDEINYGDTDKGKSLEIVRLQKETGKDGVVYKLKLNEENLKSIMLHPEVKDKPVVIVSVAGEFRTGKSFLLNIFLKYLECGRKESDWLTGDIEGFEWRGGHKGVTRGVHLWSKPFVRAGALGERVAVLLMDTQGLFDNDMTATDSAKILNIKEHLQANNMQALETFTQYSSLVEHILDHSDSKQQTPLVFLIRDWADKEAYPYGREGGTAYVKKILFDIDSSQAEIKKLLENINFMFPNVHGFLLPHPGIDVTQKEFSGNVKKIYGEFKQHIRDFVPFIMSKENLMPKKFHSRIIKGEEMLSFIKTLVSNLENSPDIPPNAEGFWVMLMNKNVKDATEIYKKEMMQALAKHSDVIEDEVIRKYHHESQKKAIDFFFEQLPTKAIQKDVVTQLEKQLEEQIRESYEKFRLGINKINESLKSKRGIFGTILMGIAFPFVYILKFFFGF